MYYLGRDSLRHAWKKIFICTLVLLNVQAEAQCNEKIFCYIVDTTDICV